MYCIMVHLSFISFKKCKTSLYVVVELHIFVHWFFCFKKVAIAYQVAHFTTPFTYNGLESLHAAINGLLPSEIRVRELSPAKPEFHARFSPKSKIYHYKIYNNPVMDPFQHYYAYHNAYKLNPVAMREAASYFVGRHDFTSFANASHNDGLPNPVKDIFRFDITEMVFRNSIHTFSFVH